MSETGGLYAYNRGKQIAADPTNTFHALIQAGFLTADYEQLDRLRYAFPEIWEAKINYDQSSNTPITVEQLLGLPDK